MTTLYIPKTIEEIDDGFLGACGSLSNLNVDEENQFYSSSNGSLFDKEKTVLIACQAPIETYVVPDSVQEIKSNTVFYLNDNIKEIILHKDVDTLPKAPYKFVTNLENVKVDEENLNYLTEDGILYNKDKTELLCFPSAKKLNSYIVPESVTSFYYDAIYSSKF
ncbi:leucine-rich repeat protein, partial [Anaerosporobacter sp.]